MCITALCRLDELVDDVLRSRLIGIPHAEVDDVFPARPRLCLQLIDNIENIRGQPLDAGEFLDHAEFRLFLCL